MVDLRNLETFVWVAQLRGFRAAAAKLNTTQPAVSARIAALEDELGARLFDRARRGAALTVKGEKLLGYPERMLQLRADMLQAVPDPTEVRGPRRCPRRVPPAPPARSGGSAEARGPPRSCA